MRPPFLVWKKFLDTKLGIGASRTGKREISTPPRRAIDGNLLTGGHLSAQNCIAKSEVHSVDAKESRHRG